MVAGLSVAFLSVCCFFVALSRSLSLSCLFTYSLSLLEERARFTLHQRQLEVCRGFVRKHDNETVCFWLQLRNLIDITVIAIRIFMY